MRQAFYIFKSNVAHPKYLIITAYLESGARSLAKSKGYRVQAYTLVTIAHTAIDILDVCGHDEKEFIS
jgi:hypothetical protein